MGYEKQNWQTGDVITAEKLNHIEDGIASGGECNTVTVIFNERAEQVDTNYTGAQLLEMARNTSINLEILCVDPEGYQRTALLVEEWAGDFGAKDGCGIVFMEKHSNMNYVVEECHVKANGTIIANRRTLTTEIDT